ncbi:MAG: 7-carboxy-7-deazaguanine synthase QueE [Deferribacterales bacterium]|nr:7-carboxy-7-deazaguanine synthase QueE [Deferribacterales bacterium]
MANSAYISEVFSSVQGEGRYIGYRQIFIRLTGCIFDCPYCDTDFTAKKLVEIGTHKMTNPVYSDSFSKAILEEFDTSSIHSFSFTGGEPLLSPDFLEECAIYLKKATNKKIFIETSGLVTKEIERFDGLADIMSVDIKTHSEKVLANIDILLKTLTNLKLSEYYLKLILPMGFSENLLEEVCERLSYYGVRQIIAQPVDNVIDSKGIDVLFDVFYKNNIEVRLIPQSHKLLGIR